MGSTTYERQMSTPPTLLLGYGTPYLYLNAYAYCVTVRDCNPRIPVEFSNPVIPGFAASNPGISGLKNCLLNAYKSVIKMTFRGITNDKWQLIPAAVNILYNLQFTNVIECHWHPTYLGVTLDRTLSCREHLTKTACKLKNRNNLLMKLAGSTCMGRQCQHSAVICSGALLFSSRVLRPSLVTLCSHGVEDPTEWLSPTVTTIKPNDSTKIGYVLCVDMRCENQADTRRHDSRPKRVKKTF